MRDPVTYPLTDGEVLDVLNELQNETIKKYLHMDLPPGDIRGWVIAELIKRITEKKL